MTIKQRNARPNNTETTDSNDSLTGSGCLVLFVISILVVLYTCSDSYYDKKPDPDIARKQLKNELALKSTNLVQEIHTQVFRKSEEYAEISEMSLNEITEIHYYLSIERWNHGEKIGDRFGTVYGKAAEELNIPVSKLKAADKYYYFTLLPELSEVIKTLYKDHSNIVIDYHQPLTDGPYGGYNIDGRITVYGQKRNTDFKNEAKKIVVAFASDLPKWVTSFNLFNTIYKDTILQTQGDVDIGFVWQQGQEIEIVSSSKGHSGDSRPTENRNEVKRLEHPKYKYLKLNRSN